MKEAKISICIPTYNRSDLVGRAFKNVLDDDRVSEIVIMDDCSTQEHQDRLYRDWYPHQKVVLYRSKENFGMSMNKRRAVNFSSNQWCILLDDDNWLGKDYIDSLYSLLSWYPDTIYCPSYAMPHFDYTEFEDITYNRASIHTYMYRPHFIKHLNTCNYFVNRDAYLSSFVRNDTVKGADTIWYAYNWLKDGNNFHITRGQYYIHAVHEGSGWKQNAIENRAKAKEILELIDQL